MKSWDCDFETLSPVECEGFKFYDKAGNNIKDMDMVRNAAASPLSKILL
jgi:hypothetical protein